MEKKVEEGLVEKPRKEVIGWSNKLAVVMFLKKRGKKARFAVVDDEGKKVELALNSDGHLCYMEGPNKKLVDGSCRNFYLCEEGLLLLEGAEGASDSDRKPFVSRSDSSASRVNVSAGVTDAVRTILKGSSSSSSSSSMPVPSAVKAVSEAAPDRLRRVLDLIVGVNESYEIFYNRVGAYTIRSENRGDASAVVEKLRVLGCEVKHSEVYLDVSLNYSTKEESVARAAGYKMEVKY